MLAYSAQDLILEPFAGLVFGLTPGRIDQALRRAAWRRAARHDRWWRWPAAFGRGPAAARCAPGPSAAASPRRWRWLALAAAGLVGPGWPLRPSVFGLGIANGAFAVAAIGSMMSLAGTGREAREGVRMGLWGAAQAIAFGLGGFSGTVAADLARRLIGSPDIAYGSVFAAQAVLFLSRPVSRPGWRCRTAARGRATSLNCRRRLRRRPRRTVTAMARHRDLRRGGGRRRPVGRHGGGRPGPARADRSLLLDRAGRIKPCGGAIPPRLIRDFAIPDGLLVARVNCARMVSPKDQQGRHADRGRLRRHGRPRGVRRVAAGPRRRGGRRAPRPARSSGSSATPTAPP